MLASQPKFRLEEHAEDVGFPRLTASKGAGCERFEESNAIPTISSTMSSKNLREIHWRTQDYFGRFGDGVFVQSR